MTTLKSNLFLILILLMTACSTEEFVKENERNKPVLNNKFQMIKARQKVALIAVSLNFAEKNQQLEFDPKIENLLRLSYSDTVNTNITDSLINSVLKRNLKNKFSYSDNETAEKHFALYRTYFNKLMNEKKYTDKCKVILDSFVLNAKKSKFSVRQKTGPAKAKCVTYKVKAYTMGMAEVHEFMCEDYMCLLEAAEENGYEWPYSSRAGASTNELAKLLSGMVDNSDQTILDDDEVNLGYILTDTSYPLSDVVIMLTPDIECIADYPNSDPFPDPEPEPEPDPDPEIDYGGGGDPANPSPRDCNGVIGGSAYIDECGECVGGNTGKIECDECFGEKCPVCQDLLVTDGSLIDFTGVMRANTTNRVCNKCKCANNPDLIYKGKYYKQRVKFYFNLTGSIGLQGEASISVFFPVKVSVAALKLEQVTSYFSTYDDINGWNYGVTVNSKDYYYDFNGDIWVAGIRQNKGQFIEKGSLFGYVREIRKGLSTQTQELINGEWVEDPTKETFKLQIGASFMIILGGGIELGMEGSYFEM